MNKTEGISVSLAAIVVTDNQGWNIASILHERAHTLGALHGQFAAHYDEVVETPVSGPQDAYWWNEIGVSAEADICWVYVEDSEKSDACREVQAAISADG